MGSIYRDAIIVATGNVLTAFYAGFVIFGILGFMAFELGTTVDNVAVKGNIKLVIKYNPISQALFFHVKDLD